MDGWASGERPDPAWEGPVTVSRRGVVVATVTTVLCLALLALGRPLVSLAVAAAGLVVVILLASRRTTVPHCLVAVPVDSVVVLHAPRAADVTAPGRTSVA